MKAEINGGEDMQFTPTEWNTVEDKQKFVDQFKRFVQSEFPERLFTKVLYQRMMNMRGHIAHYNQGGFWGAQFSTPERRADFLHHWAHSPNDGDPAWTWCDVEEVLAEWLQKNPQFEAREREQNNAIIEHTERRELARLQAKYCVA